jgi:hypothetical protein
MIEELIVHRCDKCGSVDIHRNGREATDGRQKYYCKSCKHNGRLRDLQTPLTASEAKAQGEGREEPYHPMKFSGGIGTARWAADFRVLRPVLQAEQADLAACFREPNFFLGFAGCRQKRSISWRRPILG